MEEFNSTSFTGNHCIECPVISQMLTFTLDITVSTICHQSKTRIKGITLQSLLEYIKPSFICIQFNLTVFNINTSVEQIPEYRTNQVCREFPTVILNQVTIITHSMIYTSRRAFYFLS